MTAADALQAAANLLAQARDASDAGRPNLGLVLATEALAWSQIALAIEAGAPPPNLPDRQPGGFPATG